MPLLEGVIGRQVQTASITKNLLEDEFNIFSFHTSCMHLYKHEEFPRPYYLILEFPFLYNEEYDIWMRARKSNWKVMYYPKSTVFHIGGSRTSQRGISEQVERSCYKGNFYLQKNF